MKTKTIRQGCIAGSVLLVLVAQPAFSVPVSSLPDTSLLTTYGEFGNNLKESNVTITGNVGVSSGGSHNLLNVMAPSTINGDVYVATGASVTGPGTITGTKYTGQNLTSVQNQVFTASSALAALTVNLGAPTAITAAQTFNVGAGDVYVANLTGGINLNNNNITLTGAGYLVLNISGTFSLTGTASILGDATHIYLNYIDSGTINTHVGDVINGYTFLPNGSASLDGAWFGGIYGGNGQIELLSGARVSNSPPTTVPDGGITLMMLGTGLGLVGLVKRKLIS